MEARSTLRAAARNLTELVNIPFIVGFAAALTWMGTFYSVVANDASGGVFTDSTANDVYLVSLAANALTDIALALFPRQAFRLLERKGHVVAALLMVGTTLLLAFAPLAHAAGFLSIFVGTAIAGVSSTLLLLSWALTFGEMELKSMFPSLIIAYIVMNLANTFIAMSNSYTIVALALALPLLSLACLASGRLRYGDSATRRRYLPESGQADRPEQQETSGGFPRRLLPKIWAAFFLWALVNRVFRSIYSLSANDDLLVDTLMNFLATVTVVLVVGGVIAAMLVAPDRFRFEYAYRPFLVIALAGIALLPAMLAGQDLVAGYTFNTASYHIFCMFMWVIIAACCHNYPSQAVRIYGTITAPWPCGAACGVVASNFLSEGVTLGAASLLIFGGVILLTSCYLFVFTERDAGTLAQILPIQRRRPFREKCAGVARRHGLSAREQEVMELIAQGRDTAAIQERLALSASTVQTHRAHIYRKLGIHSKQELIDVIESEGLESTPFDQQV